MTGGARSEADRNLRDFFNRHGEEGFLQLFLANYLFELVQYFLHSELKGEDDLSRLYYVNFRGELYKPEDMDRFETDLMKECGRSARTVVRQLKELNIMDRIAREPLSDPRVAKLVARQFERMLRQVVRG